MAIVPTPAGIPFDLGWAPEARPVEVPSGPDRLFALDQGQGPAVLLLHGYTCELTHYRYQLEALPRAGFRAVALDLPGHGHASKPAGPIPAERFVRGALATLDALGIQKAHLVGHSLGGTLALALAALHSDRVEKVALIGPYFHGLPLGQAFGAWVNVISRIPVVRSLALAASTRAGFEAGLGAAVLDVKKTLGIEDGRWLDYGWQMFQSPGMKRCAVGAGQALARSWRALLPEPPRLGERGLVLWGKQDGIVLHTGAAGFAERLGSRLVTLDPCGHCCHFEEPERISAELVAHFRG